MHRMVVEDPASAESKVRERFGQVEAQRAIVRRGQFAGYRH